MRRGQNFIQGVFLNLSILLKFFQFDLLCHIATLTEFRKIKPLSRHDVGSQHRDVGYPYFDHPLERRDVGLNVATSVGTSFWHVAMLALMSRRQFAPPSGMLRHWIYRLPGTSRRWIPTSRSCALTLQERHHVEPEHRNVVSVLCPATFNLLPHAKT